MLRECIPPRLTHWATPFALLEVGVSCTKTDENKKKQEQWIAAVKQYGFWSIFTSLHIPEDNPASYRELLRHLGSQAKRQGMELMADISPRSLQHRNARPLQAYLELTRECAVDRVLLGDIIASGESVRELVQTAEGVIPLRCHTDGSYACIGQVYTNRLDPARDVIRSVESRSYAGREQRSGLFK